MGLQANRHNVHFVVEAFHMLGWTEAKSASDDWQVMWSFDTPFSAKQGRQDLSTVLQNLTSVQLVNQLPGANANQLPDAHATGPLRSQGQRSLLPFLALSMRGSERRCNVRHRSEPAAKDWLPGGFVICWSG